MINRYFANLPFLRRLCLRPYIVARSLATHRAEPPPSVSVVIPCRNERDNVEPAAQRTPRFAEDQEMIFVEGHSQDGTWEEIQR